MFETVSDRNLQKNIVFTLLSAKFYTHLSIQLSTSVTQLSLGNTFKERLRKYLSLKIDHSHICPLQMLKGKVEKLKMSWKNHSTS
jgi:hypothetical protein